jgi:DNA-binding CsgD family transcriptional regulator
MTTGASLANQTIRVLAYINNSIQPEGNGAQDDVLKALYNMHKLSPTHAVITCPVNHRNFFYISENCESIFGYDARCMAEHFKEIKDYFSQIHSADTSDLKDCLEFFASFMKDESPADCHKLRAIFHYRFRNAEGKYIYLQDEKATLFTEEKKIVHYSLIRTMPVEAIFSGVKLEIYKDENVLKKIFEYKPSAIGKRLSNRENDVVRLIKQGFTTKEIAWHLSLSHNTVRNIKSKMFAKFNVNNTIELLNMAG